MLATVSLTFDDGLPCQLEYALPALDKAGLKGTFFLIENSPYSGFNGQTWKRAVASGHEVGAHSVNHLKAATLTREQAEFEASQSRKFLEQELGVPVTSFAYPFTDAPTHLRDAVAKNYQQARGGRGARECKFMAPGDRFDVLNVPSFHVSRDSLWEMPGWIAEAKQRNAWFVMMFHGVGPDETQWNNVTAGEFADVLRIISELQVLTFGQAAAEIIKG